MGGRLKDLSYAEVKKQSQAVFGQFGRDRWIPFAKENVKHPNKRDCDELRGSGAGKTLVSVAMGASLESQVETLKKHRDRCEIVTCDKGFAALMAHGVKPDYVMLCDCNIVWQKWGPTEADTDGVKLIATPYANLAWTRKWRGPIYFYANKDAINSQEIFLEIMGPGTRTIPASSNVSNAQFVFFTGMDEWSRDVFGGYEKILLVGYDYSWRPDGNYYAWSDPKPKRYYMNHRTLQDMNGDLVYSSENLIFSARWMANYLRAYSFLNVVNCSGRGILDQAKRGDLEKELTNLDVSQSRAVKAALDNVKATATAAQLAQRSMTMAREAYLYGSR